MDYVVCTNDELRKTCIENNWFTAGDVSQYEKLFDMNSKAYTFRLPQIAAVIYVCSEQSYAKIFEKLMGLQSRYICSICGEEANC